MWTLIKGNTIQLFIRNAHLLLNTCGINLETISSFLSRGGQEEQHAAERVQAICPTHEVPGELLRQTAEVRPNCDSELRGHAVLHAQRPRPAARLHPEQVGRQYLAQTM